MLISGGRKEKPTMDEMGGHGSSGQSEAFPGSATAREDGGG